MFHVGQLVVCVDDSQSGQPDPQGLIAVDLNRLTKGQVYTIRELGVQSFRLPDNTVTELLGVKVEEVERQTVFRTAKGLEFPHETDGRWGSARFRPVSKQSIEIVKSLLLPIRETEDA